MYPRRQSGDFSRGGKLVAPRSFLRATPKGTVGQRESHRFVLSKIHQATVHVFSDSCLVREKNARDGRRDGQVYEMVR